MSSHHFVREGQEPALLVADAVSFQAAADLLEWAPRVIVIDAVFESVLAWGIKIDAVYCTPSTYEHVASTLTGNFPVEIVCCQPGENPVLAAVRQEAGPINILTRDAQAVIQTVASLGPEIQVVVFEGRSRWTFHAKAFQKWAPQGSVFYLYPTLNQQRIEVSGVVAAGAEYVTLTDGIVIFRSVGPFWVVESNILEHE